MKIEVYAICYNEEVMLSYFLRHYEQFCDRIVIYDNYSTDRSQEILDAHPKVEVIKYDSGNQIRDDIYLEIKNNCWKGSTADWVIVCDIDEFVFELNAPTPIDQYTIIMPDWCEMVSDRLPVTMEPIHKVIFEGVPQGQVSKCLMFRPGALQEIGYTPGCHAINPVGEIKILHTSDMAILHYKFLSLEYVQQRHKMFGERLSDMNKKNRWGVQYEFTQEQIRMQWEDLWNRKVRVI